jgi:hypothetical protein
MDYIYYWPNGDRSIVINCDGIEEALLLLDEEGEANSSMLRVLPEMPVCVHFRDRHPYKADEYTEMMVYDKRKPKPLKNGKTSSMAMAEWAQEYIERRKS